MFTWDHLHLYVNITGSSSEWNVIYIHTVISYCSFILLPHLFVRDIIVPFVMESFHAFCINPTLYLHYTILLCSSNTFCCTFTSSSSLCFIFPLHGVVCHKLLIIYSVIIHTIFYCFPFLFCSFHNIFFIIYSCFFFKLFQYVHLFSSSFSTYLLH